MRVVAKKRSASPTSMPLRTAPEVEVETEESVLPSASSPASSSQISHNQNLSDSKTRRKAPAEVLAVGAGNVSSDEDIVYEDLASSDNNYTDEGDEEEHSTPGNSYYDEEDDDVHTEQDDDIIIQEQEDVGPYLSREPLSSEDEVTEDGESGNEETEDGDEEESEEDEDEWQGDEETRENNDEASEADEEDGYEDESEEEGSGREGNIEYEEEIELPPQPQVQEGGDRIKRSLSAPEGADVDALGLQSEEEVEKEELNAPHDEVDAFDVVPSSPSTSLPSAPPGPGQVVQPAVASPESSPQEEVPLDPVVPTDSKSKTKFIPIDSKSKSKTRIGMRLAQAVDAAPVTKNRSPELVPLTKDYDVFRKRLRTLIAATKKFHEQTKQMEQARLQVVKELSVLSQHTPLFDHVGQRLDAKQLKRVEKLGAESLATSAQAFDIQNKSVTNVAGEMGAGSMAALEQLASMQAKINMMEYQRHVVDYTVEWEQVVTSRIDKEIKQVNKLRQDRLHYEKKVDQIRDKINALEQKGKSTPDTISVKLTRNEEKLSASWKSHETSSGRLVVLIEQAVTFGWKDLYPLVKNSMRWQVNRVARENETCGRFPLTLEAMKSTFKENIRMKPVQSASLEEV
jgi:hypothetical protein